MEYSLALVIAQNHVLAIFDALIHVVVGRHH